MESGLLSEINELAKFFNDEDIILRLHFLHQLEKAYPYHHMRTADYWTRVLRTVEHSVPHHLRDAAFAVLASVIYLPDPQIDEVTRSLACDVAERCSELRIAIPGEVHIFALDHPELIDRFYDLGIDAGWRNRMDQILQRHFRTASDLVKAIARVPHASRDDINLVREALCKKAWVLVTDNALSGGSALSDIRRLKELIELFTIEMRPTLLIAAQIITSQALEPLRMEVIQEDVLWGLEFDSRFRVGQPECEMFRDFALRQQVEQLCEWFGYEHFAHTLLPELPGCHPSLERTLTIHRNQGARQDFAYGWLDGGYTLVRQSNTPTNSLPLLWYPTTAIPPDLFVHAAPFTRNHSREAQLTSGDSSQMDRIRENKDRIRRLIWL